MSDSVLDSARAVREAARRLQAACGVDVVDPIGEALRQTYLQATDEAVPPELLRLARRLDNQERNGCS